MSLLEDAGNSLGGKLVDAAAIAAAVALIRTGGIRDPKTVAGAIAIYTMTKRQFQMHGELAGHEIDALLKKQFNFNLDQFVADNLDAINDYLNDNNIIDDLTSDMINDIIDLLDDTSPINPDDIAPPPLNPPPPRDPLVLDTDKDGFISTVSLQDSNAYFDMKGDGMKQKVSWIESNDGILVYDKDENKRIDGLNEVFGNADINGFTELKQLIDSNGDNVIDRKDELFNRLQIWHDKNGDGAADDGELVSLKEEGVTSIDLDAVSTNIELGGVTITEASHYTDSEGKEELAVDVTLEFDARITTVDTSTIPNYTVDESVQYTLLGRYGMRTRSIF